MIRAEIEARIAELEAANAKATGWGAAVSARLEELKSLRAALRRLDREETMTSEQNKLLPCPFCGSDNVEAVGLSGTDQFYVKCHECWAKGGHSNIGKEDWLWNRRAPAPSPAPVVVVVPEEVTARYWNMLPPGVDAICDPNPGTAAHHLKWMLQELRSMTDAGKAMRWLGFIQGTMIANGYTTVATERDFTRPYFSALHSKALPDVNEAVGQQVWLKVGECLAGLSHHDVSPHARRKIESAITAALNAAQGGK